MGAKVLVVDVEIFHTIVRVWRTGQQYVGHKQIVKDWAMMSWAAKWRGEKEIFYADQRKARDKRNDKAMLKKLWKLLDEADIVCWHNGDKFDRKKINWRFKINGYPPPSPYRQYDTLKMSRRVFGPSSHSLDYLSSNLCNIKKSHHTNYPGDELWIACEAGDQRAFDACRKYNVGDILADEELLDQILPWNPTLNLNVYHDSQTPLCQCGTKPIRRGFNYSQQGKFARYNCKGCGAWWSGKTNLLERTKRQRNFKRI